MIWHVSDELWCDKYIYIMWSRTEDDNMAIPSKPVNRLTSPTWRTTFQGDGQPKYYVIINIRNGYEMRNVDMINKIVYWYE